MTDKTLYTEDEVAVIARDAAYHARIAAVLSMLTETYQGGPAIVRTTLEDIRRDYGITLTPAPTPPGGDPGDE